MEAPLTLLSRNILSRAMVALGAGNSNLMVLSSNSSRMCSTQPAPPSEFRPAKALVLTKTSRFEYERARHKGESSVGCNLYSARCFICLGTRFCVFNHGIGSTVEAAYSDALGTSQKCNTKRIVIATG